MNNKSLLANGKNLALVLVAAFVGLAVPYFLGSVVAWGHRIPQPDLQGDYVDAFTWAVVLGASIFIWPVPSQDKRILLRLWIVRCFVTLGFMLLYENNYGLDAYHYFAESTGYEVPWHRVGLGAGTINVIALCWLHNRILPTSYHTLKVSFSMLGLLAVYTSYRSAELFFNLKNSTLLYILGLFPSILFWSSILGKDPIVILGISLYVYGVVGWYRLKQWRYLVPLALGIAIAMFIRVWLGPILLFPLVIFAWGGIRGTLPRLAFAGLTIGAFLFTLYQFNNYFGLETAEDAIAKTNTLSRSWSHGGSGQTAQEFTSIGKIIAFAPLGIFTALFRPLPGEVMNPFGLLAGLENLLLLSLSWRGLKQIHWQTLKDPLVIWAILLILSWSTIYGFISFQNLGSGVRFKLQILPIFLTLLLYLVSKAKRVRQRLVRPNLATKSNSH